MVQSRYQHHAAASGYDQLSRYIGTPVELRRGWHIAGETIFRPFGMAQARLMGHYEYSRYDCSMELDLMHRMLAGPRAIYHFLYSEKGYRLSRLTKGKNVLVGSVHYAVSRLPQVFRNMDHFRALDAVFAMSKDSVERWQEIVGHDRVYFLPHGIDCEVFAPGADRTDKRLIFAGHHERDVGVLSAVADALLPRFRDWTLVMVSKDSRCSEIQSRHPNAIVHRFLDDDAYLHEMQRASLMVLPLKLSTACNSVLEALACGVPVVTSSGGMHSYVDGSCGLVATPGDVDSIVFGAERLMSSQALLGEAQLNARARALSFSWPNVARQLYDLLRPLW